MSTHQDTHENAGGLWKIIYALVGYGFAIFALVAGSALIYGGIVIRSGGDTAPKEKPAPVMPATPAPTDKAAEGGAPTQAAPAAAGLAEVLIKPDPSNPLAFDTKSFTVKAGQQVKLTFENKSTLPQPHNWILGKAGTKQTLINAANAMVTDPQGMAKGYIPEIPEVITHTKLLNPGETGMVEFAAPSEPGEYPYICSFPGHSMIMNGMMIVE